MGEKLGRSSLFFFMSSVSMIKKQQLNIRKITRKKEEVQV